VPASDAVTIDSSDVSADDVVDRIRAIAHARGYVR
jgi:cytidylate kinase